MLSTVFATVARSVVRRRPIWLSIVITLSLALGWVSSRLSLRLDVADFLPEESPAQQEELPRGVLRELSGAGRIAVLLESDEQLGPAVVEPIFDYLAQALEALEAVRSVHARLTPAEQQFAEEFFPRHILAYIQPSILRSASQRLTASGIEAGLTGQADTTDRRRFGSGLRREKDPLGLIRVAAGTMEPWHGVSRVRLVDGYYALPGERIFFLTLESEATLNDIASARALVAAIEDVLDGARRDAAIGPMLEGKQLYAVGRPVSFVSAFDTLLGDVVRVALAATVVVAVLLALFFGRLLAPIALLVPVGLGLIAAAASAVPLFGAVSLIAWVFIGLMVGLGVDFGVHIAVHYWMYGNAGSGTNRVEAIRSALERPGRGIVLGGLTSAAAFLAIWVIPYPAMRQVAWLTAFGLVAILVSSLTVLPLLLSFSPPAVRSQSAWSRWSGMFERALQLRPRVGLIPWVVLVTACLAVVPSLRFEPHPWRLAVRGNPESARLDRLSREMGSAFTPLLIVSRGETAEAALARDREAVTRLHPMALRAGVATIQSLARWLPNPADQRANLEFVTSNRELFSAERFRRDFETAVTRMEEPSPYLVNEYLPLVTRGLNPDLEEVTLDGLRRLGLGAEVDRHLVEHAGEFFAVSYVFLRQFPWAEGAVSGFLEVAREVGVDQSPDVTLAGDALRSAGHTSVIRRALLIATSIAVALVGGLLWFRFRRVSLVALCLAPLACGLSAALLVMWLLGIELNLLTITIAPVLVGIGVDDGIHMVERLSAGQAVATVLREAGASMTMTTLTTAGALACLGLATFAGIRELGLVGGVGLLTCLLASLHLIPLGWRLVSPTERCPSETFDA
jgi:predicted RND superfamily exporter protein